MTTCLHTADTNAQAQRWFLHSFTHALIPASYHMLGGWVQETLLERVC